MAAKQSDVQRMDFIRSGCVPTLSTHRPGFQVQKAGKPAELPRFSLLLSDSSLNLLLCPLCFSVGLVAWALPGRDAFLNVRLSSDRKSTSLNSSHPSIS